MTLRILSANILIRRQNMSKDFGVIGPFNLEESIALSTSTPHECVPWEWGNKTHLESAGSTCLSLSGEAENILAVIANMQTIFLQ